MKVTIEIDITPEYVMANAASAYWYNDKNSLTGRKGKQWPQLTETKLCFGIRTLLAWPQVRSEIVGRLMADGGRFANGDDLDTLLQLSLFGKVIYG